MAPAIDHSLTNGHSHDCRLRDVNAGDGYSDRAAETSYLLKTTHDLLIHFIANADKPKEAHNSASALDGDASPRINGATSRPVGHDFLVLNGDKTPSINKVNSRSLGHDFLVKKIRSQDATPDRLSNGTSDSTDQDSSISPLEPKELIKRLGFVLPDEGLGKDGLTDTLEKILQYSVNTWSQGFMHKLYATTNPIGVVSELILAVLNTNLHVYKVSPALSVIERVTSEKLANAFGLTGPYAGGGTHPGGSASNLAALVIARNTTFPAIRHKGNNGRNLVVFTSQDSHYSITKAAQTCGIGAKSVWKVPVDAQGRMRVDSLSSLLTEARLQGFEPFFINATAGTTVLGACDPLNDIADLCDKNGLWLHVDGSWGGAAIFSDKHRHKLQGIERARSITTNPHKMLGVPVTCSFLLASDMRVFWRANRVDAGYLFHQDSHRHKNYNTKTTDSKDDGDEEEEEEEEVSWDLADATLQCGRRGDSLKLALSWIYQGRQGLGRYVDAGYDAAHHLASLVRAHPDLVLVSTFPPPCLQVCFYHHPDARGDVCKLPSPEEVTAHTGAVCEGLAEKGLMIDFAPGPYGSFVRVVVNGYTRRETLERIVEEVARFGR